MSHEPGNPFTADLLTQLDAARAEIERVTREREELWRLSEAQAHARNKAEDDLAAARAEIERLRDAHEQAQASIIGAIAALVRLTPPGGVEADLLDRDRVVDQAVKIRSALDSMRAALAGAWLDARNAALAGTP